MRSTRLPTYARTALAFLFMSGASILLALFFYPQRISGAGPTPAGAAPTTPGVPRFQIYASPPGIADNVGEPSIGSDWKTEKTFSNSMFSIPNGGRAMLYGGFSPDLYRATFNDCCSPAETTWESKPLLLASTPRAFGDPILFTDHDTGRTFVSQLEGLTPAGSTTDITDNDGDTFMPSEGSSAPSDIDHQTFGGGRYADPAPLITTYPHAVYYASQSVSDARAARSDDGGVTFGPAIPMYTINDCAGLHGHIKVSPKDGTVYVPNVGCGGALPFHDVDAKQSVIVSEDNGMTWDIRPIPDSTTHGNGNEQNTRLQTRDPSVSIDAGGNVYFVYQAEDRLTEVMDPKDKAGDSHPKVAVSHDKGLHWEKSIDVGAHVINGGPIRNATFVTATAGDNGRAAVAFFGTETGGNNWACGDSDDCSGDTGLFPREPFTGVWYLYVSTTFDGGKTWTTQNVTPGDPIQRGGICGGSTCRNLLDFMDVQVDKEGRVLVGSEDGCIGACVQGGGNTFSAKGFIARQSGGKRMFAKYDPKEPALPAAPLASGAIDAAKTKVQLKWEVPDNGGSPITAYHVYRRAGTTGNFILIATVPETNFTDTTFNKAVRNFYHVTAVNAIGEGPFCKDLEAVAGIVVTPCVLPGVLAVTDVNPDGSDNDGGQNTPPDPSVNIRQIFVAEPDLGTGVNKLIFTMKVGENGSIAPNSGWYIVWNRIKPDPDFDRFYVAMRSDATGALSYEYGKFGVPLDTSGGIPNPNSNTPVKVGDADKGTYDPATGTIQITLTTSKADNIKPGQPMNALNGRTFFGDDQDPRGPHNQAAANDITSDGNYVVHGNASCITNRAPVAALAATPTSGPAPLKVTFDASKSSDPDAGDSIASYTFSFGDGSEEQTQNVPTITHTYKHAGSFFATCRVKDSHGQISSNVASVVVKTSAQLVNISTRLRVETGDNVPIAGFIVLGDEDKKVIVRGLGPSIKAKNQPVQGRLQDPVLELHDSSGKVIASNDNWKDTQKNEIEASGVPPSDDRESAIVETLKPGHYTAVLRGKNNTTGVGVVEVYDLAFGASSRLANLSTRGLVGTGDDVMIGGFVAGPNDAAVTRVVLRAIGPSLSSAGVPQAMQDPMLELHNRDGTMVASNDNWQDTQKADIEKTGLQPKDSRESAIVRTNFEPGPYTAIVRGKGGTTGNALVEIYDVR